MSCIPPTEKVNYDFPDCTEPSTGTKLRQLALEEIEVGDDDERVRLIMHATRCAACGRMCKTLWLRDYLKTLSEEKHLP